MQYKKLFTRIIYIVIPFACIGIFMTVDGSIFQPSILVQPSTESSSATTRFKMDRVQLGTSGMSLSSPDTFSSLPQSNSVSPIAKTAAADMLHSESFQYDSNGVVIDIDFLSYAESTEINLGIIRKQYENDLEQLKQTQKVSYTVKAIERSGIAGIIVDAEYPVQHLQKIQRFEVLTFVLQNQVWRVTAKYKDCDQKGQAMVQWMLESIQIAS